MSTPINIASAIFLALALIACSGQETNQQSTPNNQNTDPHQAIILGHWVSDCYLDDGENDFIVEAYAQEEYWFYEDSFAQQEKHFLDKICQKEQDSMIFNWETGMLEKPILKAKYNFSRIQTTNSGESYSLYKSSTTEESQSQPSNTEWEFGIHLKSNTLYIATPDLQNSGEFKINFNRPFTKN